MKTLQHITFVCVLALTFVGCERFDSQVLQSNTTSSRTLNPFRLEDPDTSIPEYRDDDAILLGHQRRNPYEISNMLNAYDYLRSLPIFHDFIVGSNEPEVNMIYYRVLPLDSMELAIIAADTTVIYFDYPLDYDIERWGSYYHDPDVADDRYTWLYAVVPVHHDLPHVQTLEILQECYLPEEPMGNHDYNQIPDWQNGNAMLEYLAYKESGNSDMFDEEAIEHYEEILSNRSSGSPDAEQHSENNRNWFLNLIYGAYPEGDFSVINTITNNSEAIQNAHVFIHNFIKFYCGPLDNHGYYHSSVRFRTNCWYHIRFANHHTQTRIFGGSKFLIGPYHRHLGWHPCDTYSATLHFEDVGWRYAAVNNAVEQYLEYCAEYSILFPYNVNVWIIGVGGTEWSGSTPLFHKRSSPLIYNWILYPLWLILEVPDMALFIEEETLRTPEIYELVFHEFSHASHYEKVGNTYWERYVTHIITNMGYGAHADGPYHGYCGIGEMWGYFAGYHFLYKCLGHDYPYIYLLPNDSLDTSVYASDHISMAFWPHKPWYKPGILARIHQDSHCSISDIYNGLNADVYSLDALKYSLEQQGINNEIINDAYDTYRAWD